ncbi:MAG: methyltransferase domain-containing protein [Polyangiales bacterium]
MSDYDSELPFVTRRAFVEGLGVFAGWWFAACGGGSSVTRELPGVPVDAGSRFRRVYGDPALRGQFLLFLTHVFHLVPEAELHLAIAEAAAASSDDRAVYEALRARFPRLGPALSSVRFALPALATQKAEMADETATLIGERVHAERYVEIGTPGRYVRALRQRMFIGDEVYLVHVSQPALSPEDIVERGQLAQVGLYTPLNDYSPLSAAIPVGKIDLVTNYIGLHHAPRAKLEAFVDSIHGALRPGGIFVLRDHDVVDASLDVLVALAHDVFNAGLGFPWAYNAAELRHFQSLDVIESYLAARGFKRFGPRLAQPGDPTHNLLVAFERV